MKNLLKRRKALEEEKRDFSLGDTASSIQDSQRASTRQLRKRGARDQMDTGNGAAETRKPQGMTYHCIICRNLDELNYLPIAQFLKLGRLSRMKK